MAEALSGGQRSLSERCQFQSKIAHFCQLKIAHFEGKRAAGITHLSLPFSCFRCLHRGAHLLVLAHALAVAPDVDDVAVVQQAINQRRRHDLVAENGAPLLLDKRSTATPSQRVFPNPTRSTSDRTHTACSGATGQLCCGHMHCQPSHSGTTRWKPAVRAYRCLRLANHTPARISVHLDGAVLRCADGRSKRAGIHSILPLGYDC